MFRPASLPPDPFGKEMKYSTVKDYANARLRVLEILAPFAADAQTGNLSAAPAASGPVDPSNCFPRTG